MAEVSGDYAGLLRLAGVKSTGGGGQAFRPSLISGLSFKIEGIALAA